MVMVGCEETTRERWALQVKAAMNTANMVTESAGKKCSRRSLTGDSGAAKSVSERAKIESWSGAIVFFVFALKMKGMASFAGHSNMTNSAVRASRAGEESFMVVLVGIVIVFKLN